MSSDSLGRAAIDDAMLGIFANKENNILESLEVGFAGNKLKVSEANKQTWHQIRLCPQSKVHEITEDRAVLETVFLFSHLQSNQAN